MRDGSILVLLKLTSRSQADLALVIDCCVSRLYNRTDDTNSDQILSYMTDDEGNQYRLKEHSGIGGFRRGNPLVLSLNTSKSVALRFGTSDSDHRGKTFSIVSDFAMISLDKEGRPQRDRNDYYIPIKVLNVSIRDLRPGK